MVDLHSLLALVAAVDAAMARALWFGVSGKRAGGVEFWSSALGVRALAIALILGAAQPQAGALALGMGLLGLSVTLQAGALLAFAARALPAWVHTATFAALAVPVQMLG